MKRVADTGKNPPSPSLPPDGSSTPATRNSKFGRWDFRSMTHFEQHPSGEMGGKDEAQLQQQRRQKTLGSGQAVPTAASQRGDSVVRRTIDEDESDNHNLGQDNDPSPPLFEEKQHYVHKMERFALQRHVTEFVLNGQNAEPDEALREALDRIIERAVQNTERESGRRVTKLGILLDGRGLSDPIVMPIRPPEQNSADALMAELDKLGQSGGDEDVHGGGQSKRSLLLSEPVQIIVTCLAPPTGAAPRFHHYQHWGYDERQRIRIRNSDDSFCMFYALVAARAYSDQAWLKLGQQTDKAAVAGQLMSRPDFCINQTALNNLLSNGDKMRRAATNLMEQSGIDAALEAYGMEHLQIIQHYWDQAYPGMYRVVLFADQPEELPRPVWKGSAGRRFNISLFHSEGHYDAIKKINCFFKLGKKYCVDCECTYTVDVKHTMTCKSRCPQCAKVGPQQPCVRDPGLKIQCEQCNRFFFSQSCFDSHLQGQTCSLLKRCHACSRTYQFDAKRPHKCYTSYCARCKVYHEKDAGCFIKKISVPRERQKYRILCWDTETRLEALEAGQQRHKVNHLSAQITCTECCDSPTGDRQNCEICVTDEGEMCRAKDWSEAAGDNPLVDFVEWILRAWSNKYKTYLWAHNASRFDGHFVLKYLGETRRRPDVVMNGLKIFEFRLQHSRLHSLLTWRDSCLLMPVRLEDLPRTFNLDCADKPFFPYAFNCRENYNVRLTELPDKDDYCHGSMKKDKFEKFEKWYDENKATPFFLPDELRAYCQNDTEILLKAIVRFRHILMRDVTCGFDVLPLSCTIASVCMNIFKGQFLKEKQLAIVPERGYERNDRASVFAIKYLDWRAKNDGIDIQHAGNGLEKRWKQFKLDGWIEEQNRCIEVLGCYWHGCARCFDPDDKLVDEKTCRELNEATLVRLLQLREPDNDGQSLDVEEIWECEINAQLAANAEMRTFFADLGMERGPIDPRQAYYGGRTGPLKLFAEPKEDEKISVFDIISLYPWVNYASDYPVGIPTIIHPKQDEMCVSWTRAEDLHYRGIYRVRVIPPRGLRIPVLPVKIDERLLFCCCHHCASTFRKTNTRRLHKCLHTEEQRAFTGNYTHIELERALERGYKVDRFWRAWHYEDWSDQIFKEYVRLLIKLKIESSGFPDCINTVEQKQHYADENRRIYFVNLDPERISKNPGLRFIAKLMLNSLWGKFSMRNQLGTNKVLTRPQEFFKLLLDHKVEISAIVPISEEAIRVLYKSKKNFVAEHSSSNIVISLWTTSRARLKLLDYMTQIDETEGAKLLYTDTDSVVVLHKRDRAPLQTGEFLGQMSEEYVDFDIKTFICGGAKQYGFRMLNKKTGRLEYVQKIRGITFDVNNNKALQFDRFAQKVMNYGQDDDPPAVFSYRKIMPTRDSKIVTREQRKRYLPICQKGIIDAQYNVFPFGYE